MADGEHLGILKQGVAAWNKWRASNPVVRPNLTFARLWRADLTRAELSGANLTGADLTGAYLLDTDLTLANLSGAELSGANLTAADLTGADLTDASLTGADLSHANHLTQDQLNSACIRKGGKSPTLPEDLKPPQKVCVPWWKPR